jgi:hypothetical protein
MKGSWIIKEVYFEDGFPKIIRDLKPETPDDPPDDRGSTVEVPGKYRGSWKFPSGKNPQESLLMAQHNYRTGKP